MREPFLPSNRVLGHRAGPLARTPARPGCPAATWPSSTMPAPGTRRDRRPQPRAAVEATATKTSPLGGDEVTASGGPAWYEIRVAGVLDSRWAAWFDGLQVSGHSEETVIFGLLTDQPALHGLLAKVRDLGLTLIAVRRLDPRSGDEATP
jgi:hypothetical protein